MASKGIYVIALFTLALLAFSLNANTVSITASMNVIASTTTSSTTTTSTTTTTTIPAIGIPSIIPLNPTIFHDVGVIFNSTWTSSLGPYTANLYMSGSSTCNSLSTLVQSTIVVSNSVSFTVTYPTSYQPYFCIFVTDYKPATTNSVTSLVSFNPKTKKLIWILPWPWRNMFGNDQ